MGYQFFLSYAREDMDAYLEAFCIDLSSWTKIFIHIMILIIIDIHINKLLPTATLSNKPR